MKQRVEDKIPAIRGFAVCVLFHFASDGENGDTVNLFLQSLPQESNEVRKTIVLSMPPSNDTSTAIVASMLAVSDAVRRAAYCVLASKFPLNSNAIMHCSCTNLFSNLCISIKLRTIVLQRGLSDRSPSVTKGVFEDAEWLTKCCGGDPVTLLRFLDVKTYESVGETVMEALLKIARSESKKVRGSGSI